MNSLVIIESPSNLGLKEPTPGHEPGVKLLPKYLKKNNFYEFLSPDKIYTLIPPSYSMNLDEISGVRNADNIIQYAKGQADLLKQIITEKEYPIVIGGDCSILVGNAFGLKKLGYYGLFFLDGHTDFMWPALSQTGGAAGMDLALVTGYGHDKLTNIESQKPYFEEHNVWCVGNRDYEDWYVQAITESNINYFDLKTLRQMGVRECANSFLKMIEVNALDGFWIHIDVDVLNDLVMPAVDSRQQDGLEYSEFNEIIQILVSDSKSVGLQITILDPELDPSGKYTKAFVDNFCKSINIARRIIT